MNQKRMALWALAGSSVCAAACAWAADPTAASAPMAPQDEVIIEAHREKLSQLRRQIARSEDAFFDAYNHINTVRAYDVHCRSETPIDTNISGRVCKPRFVEDALADEASNFVAGLTSGGVQAGPHGQSANAVINAKSLDYSRHLVEIAGNNPKLLKMLHDYDALTQHYEAVRKVKLHGKWIYFGD